MRMNDSDLKFDPQVMALAMPTESGFTKAAEGISNLGKVFLDSDARKEASALNALKMEEANQSIIGKSNENSVFGEKQEREKSTWLADIRNKQRDGIKKDFDNAADVKKQTDNGFLEEYKKMVPSSMFNDPKTGKFSEDIYGTVRKGFEDNGGWTKDNIHLFSSLADGYRKESLDNVKTLGEIDNKAALTNKTNLEATTVVPESISKRNSLDASANSSNASAEYNRIKTKQAPQELALDQKRETRMQTSDDEQKKILQRMKETVGDNFGKSIAGYTDLSEEDQSAYKDYYNVHGVKPTVMVKTTKAWYGDANKEYSVKYPASVPAATSTPIVAPEKTKSIFQQSLENGEKKK